MPRQFWNTKTEADEPRSKQALFEATFLPYLNSAYNLARWFTRNEHDAEDLVQEAYLRALRSFDTFIFGSDARAWLLAIVRNCCRTWYRQSRSQDTQLENDPQAAADSWSDPEAVLIKNANSQLVRHVLETLPLEYREILILRELEELSYKEIAHIIEIPLGTVMSRLSRARRELYLRLGQAASEVCR